MSVVPMQKISICAHKTNRKAVLETLQSMGVLQIITDEDPDPGLRKKDTYEARASFEKNAERADQALAILDKYAPVKKGLFAGIAGKEEISGEKLQEIISRQKECMSSAKHILNFEKIINDCKGNILKDENLKENLVPWMKLTVPLSFTGTKSTVSFIGTVNGTYDEAAIYSALLEKDASLTAVTAEVLFTGNDSTNVFVLCLKKDTEKAESALRALGFTRPAQAVLGIPKRVSEDCDKDIDQQNMQIESCVNEIKERSDRRKRLMIAADYYRTRAEKYRLLGTLPQSEHAFFMQGWVPSSAVDDIVEVLTKHCGAVVEKEEIKEEEVAPTALKNNSFSKNFEGIVASYGLPKHGKVDPTTIMSAFYVFFFGMMLSDAAYGIIMAVATFIVLKKYPKMGEGLRKALTMFFWCGISTTFWGFMFGGFFGNAIDAVATTFFGYTGDTILKPLWFEPLTHPMQLLIWCMLFGVIHLYTGLGIKGYEMLKDHDIAGFLFDVLAWYVFLTGLILMLLPTSLFASISQLTITFPIWLSQASKWMAIIGAVVILLTSGRSHKNWALRIALGAYDLYGVTSWLSDVLSYSRLLALGLATGVIATVVNTMGTMAGGGVGGAIIFILVFIAGHTLNMAINLLGAYVHTNRLQYVEFFGKFYEAGGIPFRPFTTNTKYIDVKEEAKA